jgi:uncharacterized membrane protein YbhN (UPF0104 family)
VPSTSPARSDRTPPTTRRRWLGRSLGIAAGGLLLASTVGRLDLVGGLEPLTALGPALALAALPQLASQALHASAWAALLRGMGHPASARGLVAPVLGAEAARVALPAGAAAGDALAVWSVRSRLGATWTEALASVAAKRGWIVATHGALVAALAPWIPDGLTVGALDAPALRLGLALTSLALLALGGASLALAGSSPWVHRLAGNVRDAGHRVFRSAEAEPPRIERVAHVARGAHARAALLSLAQWGVDVAEAWLFLRVARVDIGLGGAALVRLAGSAVRSAAFFVPAGLGAQDASAASLIVALAPPGSSSGAAAFVLLDRLKDAVFLLAGLAALALARSAERSAQGRGERLAEGDGEGEAARSPQATPSPARGSNDPPRGNASQRTNP